MRVRVVETLFAVESVGRVYGLRLDNGSSVVVKVLPPRWSVEFLEAVQRVQSALWSAGFPCPRPLALLDWPALVESLLPDPGAQRPAPSLSAVSAAGLARQIELCRGLDGSGLEQHPLRDPGMGVFPEPHSAVFDFAATCDGAEWIEEIGAQAKAVRVALGGPTVIAHTDWSARNVRLSRDGIVAAYDWDSLALVPEAQAVGQAAATWSATGDGDQDAPTVEDLLAYADAYERARGSAWSDEERRVVLASAIYVLAYTARCEHAVDPDEHVHRRARSRLRADGERLLALSG